MGARWMDFHYVSRGGTSITQLAMLGNLSEAPEVIQLSSAWAVSPVGNCVPCMKMAEQPLWNGIGVSGIGTMLVWPWVWLASLYIAMVRSGKNTILPRGRVMTLWGWDLYPEIGLGAHVRCRSDRGHFICPFVGSGVNNDTWGPVSNAVDWLLPAWTSSKMPFFWVECLVPLLKVCSP